MNLNKIVCLVMAEVLRDCSEDLREECEILSGLDVDVYMQHVMEEINRALAEEAEARGVHCLGDML